MTTSFSMAQELARSSMPPSADSATAVEWKWACEEVGVAVLVAAASFGVGKSDSAACSICSSCWS